MSLLKCKMCGGALEISEGQGVATCEYCGTQQTVPRAVDDVVTNLFNRANNLRIKCEFDKAEQIYEKIVQLDDSEAEAHWGIVLCKYGIEYVEDPKNLERIPTCHRTMFEAVTSDADYLAAVDYSDPAQQRLYEAEARKIDRIQKDILSIVANEKPFDIFICYKETDENGKRTIDSSIANDIYHQLTQEGFKVFYAAITLEDKLGQVYEPYIFAALNSAKVMLVLGTRPEYYAAVWVKNEWSRFMKLMKTDRSKLLIPCYRDMDAYDLPEEFAHLQAQDMGKIGFINDVIRGIKKVANVQQDTVYESNIPIAQSVTPTAAPLLKRAFMYLEDEQWNDAIEYAEKVLDLDPECAEAYLCKLMAQPGYTCRTKDELKQLPAPLDEIADISLNYRKVIRFADEELITELDDVNRTISQRLTEESYQKAKEEMSRAKTVEEFSNVSDKFSDFGGYKDSEKLIVDCQERIKEIIYSDAVTLLGMDDTTDTLVRAREKFESIREYRDSAQLAENCQEKINSLIYDRAVNLFNTGEWSREMQIAKDRFEFLGDYKDSKDYLVRCEEKSEKFRLGKEFYEAEIKQLNKRISELRYEIRILQEKIRDYLSQLGQLESKKKTFFKTRMTDENTIKIEKLQAAVQEYEKQLNDKHIELENTSQGLLSLTEKLRAIT